MANYFSDKTTPLSHQSNRSTPLLDLDLFGKSSEELIEAFHMSDKLDEALIDLIHSFMHK